MIEVDAEMMRRKTEGRDRLFVEVVPYIYFAYIADFFWDARAPFIQAYCLDETIWPLQTPNIFLLKNNKTQTEWCHF